MKVTAILKGKIDSNGHQPIYIRVNQGDNRNYFSTGIKVEPDLFVKGQVSGKHPKAKQYNEDIKLKIIKLQAQALEGFKKKEKKLDLYTYINRTIPHLTRSKETLKHYSSQVRKLQKFQPSVNLSDINHDFLNRYKAYLKQRGNDPNTVWNSFKFLKTFIHKAIKDKLIEDPFLNYEFPKYIPPHRNYLTEEEVKKIDKFCLKCSPDLMEVGTWFLISCYTGMRISDVEKFHKEKNIVGGRLVFKTQKTGEIVGLPISDKLKKYFQRIEYKPLSVHRNTYNKLLKVIAHSVGIKKNIHSHLARHSAAMMLANAGVSIEVTGKILGHIGTKNTEIYYKISNARIDKEMKKLK